jgi:hypothetical protein
MQTGYNIIFNLHSFQFQFINEERLESQTSESCQWQAPSKFARTLYPKGESFIF